MAMWCLELAKLRTPLPAGGTRRDRQIAEQSPGELGRGLAEVAGFAHLGEPSSPGRRLCACIRLGPVAGT